ncbi:protein kinase domain-containing protein [Pirellulaceae bacterium SH449]
MLSMSTLNEDQSSIPTPCPGRDELQRYLLGLTDDREIESLENHLECCPRCNDFLSELEAAEPDIIHQSFEEGVLSKVLQTIKVDRFLRNSAIMEVPDNLGVYRIVGPLGYGGMGRVYAAEHTKLHRKVALKLLPVANCPPSAVERFEREVMAAGKIQHAAIVHATDAGIESGFQYLAMEIVNGWDLARIAVILRTASVADICEIARQVALALSYAHSLGMIHRDIKPSNLMLDKTGQPKLLDFGLVLFDQWTAPTNDLTTVGQFLGTFDYMAPEQAERSGTVDSRSDIYSLGATLFRMLTGQNHLGMSQSQSPLEKIRLISEHNPIRVETLRPDLPSALCKLVNQMLCKHPEDRPAVAAHVAESLEPYCKTANLLALSNYVELHSNELADQSNESLLPPLAARQRPSIRVPRHWAWIATSFLPFLVYFGVTLTIQSDSGTLVIQSELEDVSLKLRKLKSSTQRELSIKHGNSLTTLQSGEYEAVIESATDQAEISDSLIVLKKGETVVARITKAKHQDLSTVGPKEMKGSLGTDEEIAKLGLPTETLVLEFDGKSIRSLMRSVMLERSFDRWSDAANSLYRGLSETERESIYGLVIEIAKKNGFVTPKRSIAIEWISDEMVEELFVEQLEKRFNLVESFREIDEAIDIKRFRSGSKLFETLERKIVVNLTLHQISEVMKDSQNSMWSNERLLSEHPGFLLLHPLVRANDTITKLPPVSMNSNRCIDLQKVLLKGERKDKWTRLWSILPELTDLQSNNPEFLESTMEILASKIAFWADSEAVMPTTSMVESFLAPKYPFISLGATHGYSHKAGAAVRIPDLIAYLEVCGLVPKEYLPAQQLELLSRMLQGKITNLAPPIKGMVERTPGVLGWSSTGDLQIIQETPFQGMAWPVQPDEHDAFLSLALIRWIQYLQHSDRLSPAEVFERFQANFIDPKDLLSENAVESYNDFMKDLDDSEKRERQRDFASVRILRYVPKANRLEIELAPPEEIAANLPSDGDAQKIILEMMLEKAGWRINSLKSGERVVF